MAKEKGVEFDDRFHRTVITLDFALGLRVKGATMDLVDVQRFQKIFQSVGNESRAIIGEQARTVFDMNVLNPGVVERDLKSILNIGGRHRRGQSPGQNVTGKIVQNGTQIVPPPTDDLELGEIRLPHLIDPFSRGLELITRSDQVKGRTGNEVEAFQDAIHTGF